MTKKFRVMFLAFVATASTSMAWGADITVVIDGAGSAQGEFLIGLYDKAENFPKGARFADLQTPATTGVATIVFKNVTPGKYAISAFHDANKNHRLDLNMQGVPIELTGASRGAIGRMGPPVFEDAVFTVSSSPITQVIHLK